MAEWLKVFQLMALLIPLLIVVDGVFRRRVIRVQRITGIEYNELRG